MREICARGFFRKDFHLLVNFLVTSLRRFYFMESRATFSCFYHSPVSMICYRNTIHKENYVNPWKYFLSRIVIGNATIWHWAGESVKCICEKMLWKKLLIRDRVEERKTNTKLGKHFLGFVRLPASLLFSRTSLFIYLRVFIPSLFIDKVGQKRLNLHDTIFYQTNVSAYRENLLQKKTFLCSNLRIFLQINSCLQSH